MESVKLVSNQGEVADIMNVYYVNVTNDIDQPPNSHQSLSDHDHVDFVVRDFSDHPSVKSIRENTTSDVFSFRPTNTSEVETILSTLNPKKAAGYDNIPPKLFRISSTTS